MSRRATSLGALLMMMRLVSAGTLACGEAQSGEVSTTGEEEDGASATTGAPTTTTGGGATGGTMEGTGATENSSAAADASDEGGGFIVEPDGNVPPECGLYAQDCPEGEKCAPWADDGGNAWNAVRCVPVTGDGQPGEPCTAEESGVSGRDDCEKGAMCWDVDAELHGYCAALCTGSVDMPVCADDKASCRTTGDGVFDLCLPDCDPLLQDCPGDDLCLPFDDHFLCLPDASGDAGAAFDPCEYANDCDPGLICAASAAAMECDPRASGCCTPMCGLDDPDFVCPGVGQECVSLYEDGEAPPKHANLGYCTVPG